MKKLVSIIIVFSLVFLMVVQNVSAANTANGNSAGDVNADNKINLSDVSLILKYIAKWSNLNIKLSSADVTSDGKVNLSDVSVILKYIAKWNNICLGHTYSKYKCTKCGEVDKAHAYEYLIEWVKKNGEVDGSHVNFDYYLEDDEYVRFSLTYEANRNCLYLNLGEFISGNKDNYLYCAVYLDDYSYFFSYQDYYEVFGYLDASKHTNNSPITYEYYEGSSENKHLMIGSARVFSNELINWLDWCLEEYDVGITIQDLGFKSYVA